MGYETMGIDLKAGGRRTGHKSSTKVIKTQNPYTRLLIKLYKFLARRTDSKFCATVAKRLHMSKVNQPPIGLNRLAKYMTNKDGKTAVIVGKVTDDEVQLGPVLVELKGGHAANPARLGHLVVHVDVDLDEDNVVHLLIHRIEEWRDPLARAAPGRGKVNDHQLVAGRGQRLVERGFVVVLRDAAPEPEHEVERRLLLDVVVREGPAVLELLPGEDQPLLVRRDPLLVLDLGLDVLDRVRRLDLERDRLARQRLDEDLHPAPEPEHQVQRRLLLDVVVRERPAVLELLASEDEPLLVGRDALLVLDLRFHVFDRVRRLDLERDR